MLMSYYDGHENVQHGHDGHENGQHDIKRLFRKSCGEKVVRTNDFLTKVAFYNL